MQHDLYPQPFGLDAAGELYSRESICTCLRLPVVWLRFIVHSEDRGDMFCRNAACLSTDHMAL
jgi:hypothetical protein